MAAGCVCVVALLLAGHLMAIEGTSWAVKVEQRGRERGDLEAAAEGIASSMGLVSRGRVEPFADIFLFEEIPSGDAPGNEQDFMEQLSENTTPSWYGRPQTSRLERSLTGHRDVVWAGRQDPLRREKKGWVRRKRQVEFDDPSFHKQWHLVSG